MPLRHRRLDTLTEADIQTLITEGVRENRRIDYKRELPGGSDEAKREFLYDVSSFANASGGDIIFGIDEAAGAPTELIGLEGDPDATIRRLDDILLSGVSPRLPGVRSQAVFLASGRFVVVLRIPQSWTLPHMVTFRNSSRFYSRTSAGKYQLDVGELRALFALSGDTAERIRAFRDERLTRIVAGEGAFPMGEGPLFLLHVIPFRAMDPTHVIDVRNLQAQTELLPPINRNGYDARHNLDGFATHLSNAGETSTYLQVFRSGALEAVEKRLLMRGGPDHKVIFGSAVARELAEYIPVYLRALRALEVELPVVALVTLFGVRGYYLSDTAWYGTQPLIARDVLQLPELIVDEWEISIAALLRPALDALWNAGGRSHCTLYRPDGELQFPG